MVIDVHAHFLPAFVLEEVRAAPGFMGMEEQDGLLAHREGFRYPITPAFHDVGAKLAEMDRLGIGRTILSCPPTLFFYHIPPDEACEFARRANASFGDLVRASDRLDGLATLPMQAPAEAASELARAVLEDGLLGAHIGVSQDAGRPLDDPALEPVLRMAEELDVALFLHPYYLQARPLLGEFHLMNSIGHPLDTVIAAARLIYTGTLDRFPRLKVVLFHGGGFLPYQLGRLDHAFSVRDEAQVRISKPPSAYLGRFWMDTITHSDKALTFLVDLVGVERLVLGTDLPFDMADVEPLARLGRVALHPAALGDTAETLLSAPRREVRVPDM